MVPGGQGVCQDSVYRAWIVQRGSIQMMQDKSTGLPKETTQRMDPVSTCVSPEEPIEVTRMAGRQTPKTLDSHGSYWTPG